MWIEANIALVLQICGVLTCSMIAYALMPRAINRFIFNEEISGNLLAYRSWGIMIFASGLMLIYAASHAEARLPILLYSIVGKSSFIVPVLTNGRYLKRPAFPMALADVAMVALFAWYLLS
ncbi:MAG TPA: hypothetical protein VGT78_00590 [Rhizomicrobium sp.]|nr:hypothetical protein [Rhizomicrobium sp.]